MSFSISSHLLLLVQRLSSLSSHSSFTLHLNLFGRPFVKMASSSVNAEPIPTSSVLMASSKHIGLRCHDQNVAFLKCKKKDANPEKCLDKGHLVTRCVFGLLKDLHDKCTKEMDAYSSCMYYHTNEFDLCRKEQQEFEKACPL